MSEMKPWLILPASVLCAAASPPRPPVTADTEGLSMVPAQCWTQGRQQISLAGMLVIYNKIIKFQIENVTVRSRIAGGTVWIKYSDEGGEAFVKITEILPNDTTDVRLYHAILGGKPVVLWEETVENVSGRAGIVEYRGKGLYPFCEGVIHRPARER